MTTNRQKAQLLTKSSNTPKKGVFVIIEGGEPVYSDTSATFTLKLVDSDGKAVQMPMGDVVTIDLQFGSKPHSSFADTKEAIIGGNSQTHFSVTPQDGALDINESCYQVRISHIAQNKGLIAGLKIGSPNQAVVRVLSQTGEESPEHIPSASHDNTASLSIIGESSIPKGNNAVYKISLNKYTSDDLTVDVSVRSFDPITREIIAIKREAIIPEKKKFAYFILEVDDDAWARIPPGNSFQVAIANPRGGGFDRVAIAINSVTSMVVQGISNDELASFEPLAHSVAKNIKTPPEQKSQPLPARQLPTLSLTGPNSLPSATPFQLLLKNLPSENVLEDIEITLFYLGLTTKGQKLSGMTSVFIHLGRNQTRFKLQDLDIPRIEEVKKLAIEISEIKTKKLGQISIDQRASRIITKLKENPEDQPQKTGTKSSGDLFSQTINLSALQQEDSPAIRVINTDEDGKPTPSLHPGDIFISDDD